MSAFTSTKYYEVSYSFIPQAIEAIKGAFEADGFDFEKQPGTYNKSIVTVTKGNLVKQAVGLKQGLEISFESNGDRVYVEAKGVVIKNQMIASVITLFITWPVLIPQIIGLIKQAKLDERAIDIIDSAYDSYTRESPVFCTHCGGRITGAATRCPHCDASLERA